MNQHKDLESLARSLQGRSPIRGSLLLLTILSFFSAALFWAWRTEIDDVTRADGRIVPSGDVQVIEAVEDGVLLRLVVEEGQIVEKGDLLMELDGALLSSRRDQEQQRAYGLMARMQRLQAEINGSELIFDENLVTQAPDVVKSEAALFRGRLDTLSSEISILENRRTQRRQELEEGLVTLETADSTLGVIVEERALIEPLVERGIEPRTTLLTLRRTEADWDGRRVRAEAALVRLQSALDEIDQQINAEKRRYTAEALTELSISTAELAALRPTLPALEQRADRALIRAPVRGVVNRLHRTTLGSMTRSGEELVEIVPLDDNLLVEAYIRPNDIAFIYPGQRVKVKISAYDFARYGSLEGEIIRIGADTIQRSERSEEEVFVAEIRTNSNILDAAGKAVQIMPGMIAQIDILAGQKTILDYLTRPVIKIKTEAFRE